jgi:predicted nucleotidyltransferase
MNDYYFIIYKEEITELCRQYHVKKLFAYGSVLTDSFNDQSDVDLIVDFDKQAINDHFLHYFDFKGSM